MVLNRMGWVGVTLVLYTFMLILLFMYNIKHLQGGDEED